MGSLVGLALLAPILADRGPFDTSLDAFQPPGVRGFLGTDNLGRDVWSGLVHGARVSLTIGILSSVMAMAIGVTVGGTAGFRGGWIDLGLMRLAEFFQVIPQFFLALVLVALVGRGIDKVILVLGVLGWPLVARVVRIQFLTLRQKEFVEASYAMGASDRYVALRVILPNVLPMIVIAVTHGVAQAILLEAGISFFGLGDANLMSWGQMLNGSLGYFQRAPWTSIFPGLAIFLAALGFSLVGDGINDLLNPRLRARSR